MRVEWNYDPETRERGFLFVIMDGDKPLSYHESYAKACAQLVTLQHSNGDSE